MTELVRVRDKETGHEYSVSRVRKHQEQVDKPAADKNGNPLPPKHNIQSGRKATSKAQEA